MPRFGLGYIDKLRKKDLDKTLEKLAGIFVLEKYTQKVKPSGKILKLNPKMPVWDALDAFGKKGGDYISVGGGRCVECVAVLKKVRIPFFLLLAEFESRLFRIHEWSGKDAAGLNEKYINELIKELVDSDLVKMQKVYASRKEFKEDLKAVSAFRNVIMHVNKKLERDLEIETIIKRKSQIFKLLGALQQILDNMRK